MVVLDIIAIDWVLQPHLRESILLPWYFTPIVHMSSSSSSYPHEDFSETIMPKLSSPTVKQITFVHLLILVVHEQVLKLYQG